jgi:hypothetical protein
LGLALLPRAAATPPPARTVLRELSGLELNLPIGLVLLADEISPSRALEALLILLHKELRAELASSVAENSSPISTVN